MQRLQGFGEAMTSQGYDTATRVVFNDYVRPSQEVANVFSINRSSRVLNVRRIRYLNHEPISVDDSYFPDDIGKLLFVKELNQDIFPLLENELNTLLSYADIKIESATASAEIATQLNVEPNAPILKIIRMVYSEEDRLIDYEHLYYRGDAFQYQLRVNRY
jgi:GntR family transcriptional regulator